MPARRTQPPLAQRLMEAPLVAPLYEHGVRPLLTRLVSPLGYADEAAFLERWVPERPDGHALDLSCGTGRYTRWLAARLGAEHVIGMDLSEAMLARARLDDRRAGLRDLALARASALALPLGAASLSVAVCFSALHLYPDVPGALGELARALEPGGRLVVLTTSLGAGPLDALRGGVMRATGVRPFEAAELEGLLARAGFRVEAFERAGAMALVAATRR